MSSELFSERRLRTPEVELNYAEGPRNGPAFVVLHGGAGRWQYGERLLEALYQKYIAQGRIGGQVVLQHCTPEEQREIARLLGCSIGNSKSQLHKARNRLRHLMRKVKYSAAPTTKGGNGRPTSLTFDPLVVS